MVRPEELVTPESQLPTRPGPGVGGGLSGRGGPPPGGWGGVGRREGMLPPPPPATATSGLAVTVERRKAKAKTLVIPAATYAVASPSRPSAATGSNVVAAWRSGMAAPPSVTRSGCQP